MSEEKYRILVVDDNTAIHEDFRKILVPAPSNHTELDEINALLLGKSNSVTTLPQFEIDSALQGQEAVTMVAEALANQRPYAIVFMDIVMPPGEDGIISIDRIWKHDPDIQTVICTAYAMRSWEEIRTILGTSDRLFILKKPFDSIEVIQLTCTLCQRWKLNQAMRRKLSPEVTEKSLKTAQIGRSYQDFKRAVASLAEVNEKLKKNRF